MTLPLTLSAARSLLLLVDFQARLLPAIDGGEAALAAAGRLSAGAGLCDVPRLITEHCADKIGGTDPRTADPAIPVVAKTSFGAWGASAFAPALAGRREIVVCGAETHVCVLQTVMQMLERDYRVFVVADAVGSRTPQNKALGLARMQAAGATITSTEMVLFEWLGGAGHARFREVMALIK